MVCNTVVATSACVVISPPLAASTLFSGGHTSYSLSCTGTQPSSCSCFNINNLKTLHHRGYLLTQVLGGVWADRFGGKRVLGFGVLWWSLATALTPFAAMAGLPALLFARACMGVGEGVAMPAMNNMLSRCECVLSFCVCVWKGVVGCACIGTVCGFIICLNRMPHASSVPCPLYTFLVYKRDNQSRPQNVPTGGSQ